MLRRRIGWTWAGIFLLASFHLSTLGQPNRSLQRVAATDDQRWALVIGNADYPGARLENPLHDARAMAQVLENLDFQVDLHLNVTHAAMEDAVRIFGQRLHQGGVGLFYFAGHGVQIEGHNYLIPVDAAVHTEIDVKYKSVNLGFLLDKIDRAQNGLNIVILDACRDNPFRRFRTLRQGLAPAHAPQGTILAYATGPGRVAADGLDGHGRFTEHLLDALDVPGWTIETIFKRTREAVVEATDGTQVPWTASSLVGEFIPRPPTEKATPEMRETPEPKETTEPTEPAGPMVRAPDAGDLWRDPVLGMSFRYIPAGHFRMGSPEDEPGYDDDEEPRLVNLTRGFWMGETEVTQNQWRQLMGNNPSRFQECGVDCPVEQMSWYGTLAYANLLSTKAGFETCYELEECNEQAPGEGLECEEVKFLGPSCSGYRLPTEAEWERAARADTLTAYWNGDDLSTDQANYNGKPLFSGRRGNGLARKKTVPVRTFGANPWGLHEIHGNVREWVWDWYGPYSESAETDPIGVDDGDYRVFRGGGWADRKRHCRGGARDGEPPTDRDDDVGFRLVRTVD